MSEKFSPHLDEGRLEAEVANRTDKRGGGEKEVKTTDIIAEEAAYTKQQQVNAANRTIEVAERIKTAKEINKQRGILARIGMKIGIVNKTSEKEVAFDEATTENERIKADKARVNTEMEQIKNAAELRTTEAKNSEGTRLIDRNNEINQQMLDIENEIRELDEKEALSIKEERDKHSWSDVPVVYSVNPDGSPNTDPNRKPTRNSTGVVEEYRLKKAELRKQKEDLTKEFEENYLKLAS